MTVQLTDDELYRLAEEATRAAQQAQDLVARLDESFRISLSGTRRSSASKRSKSRDPTRSAHQVVVAAAVAAAASAAPYDTTPALTPAPDDDDARDAVRKGRKLAESEASASSASTAGRRGGGSARGSGSGDRGGGGGGPSPEDGAHSASCFPADGQHAGTETDGGGGQPAEGARCDRIHGTDARLGPGGYKGHRGERGPGAGGARSRGRRGAHSTSRSRVRGPGHRGVEDADVAVGGDACAGASPGGAVAPRSGRSRVASGAGVGSQRRSSAGGGDSRSGRGATPAGLAAAAFVGAHKMRSQNATSASKTKKPLGPVFKGSTGDTLQSASPKSPSKQAHAPSTSLLAPANTAPPAPARVNQEVGPGDEPATNTSASTKTTRQRNATKMSETKSNSSKKTLRKKNVRKSSVRPTAKIAEK